MTNDARPVLPSQVSVMRDGPIAVVRFANPPDGVIAVKGATQLHDHISELLADDGVRAIVLTGGQAGVFIRHADVAQIERAATALHERQIEPEAFVGGAFPALGNLIAGASKPVVAAIDGVCMGGGFEIALCCTVRIASANADRIGLPEIRIGIFPGAGGTQRLPALIGAHRARLFMLQGAIVDAARALELGLIDELKPDALDRAVAIAHDFARRPAAAIAAIMDLTRPCAGPGFDRELIRFAELLRDAPEIRDRLRQFVEQQQRLDGID